MIEELIIKTSKRNQMTDITSKIRDVVERSGIEEGACHVFVPHTTAAVTVNEKADPHVAQDIVMALERTVPEDLPFRHSEGNSDAHTKSTMTGVSELLIVSGGRLVLGTWQAVFFCEYDGPRTRRCLVRVSP